ncbi:trypsin-like serine protease [Lentzea sp. HUAS12]|uniref:S1 family peptidase n=1 Tax=Lentzea sp. HUAS12 TaxID=2951806 RepID=UPI0020A0D4E9|nr:trypsin-like serine protease [Lentzea sp. HUAS12]USX55528.1 trypsin-like serine protease [Lentzea sp. HUAS12]
MLSVGVGALTAAPAAAVSGGEQAAASDAPWMVTIANKGERPLHQRAQCGGALIAPDRVATAGHCLDTVNPSHKELYLGGGTLSTDPGRKLEVKVYAIHGGYRTLPAEEAPWDFEKAAPANDIAVVVLAEPVKDVTPLRIAKKSPAAGTPVTAFGHGLTAPIDPQNPEASLGDQLKRGEFKTIEDGPCDEQLDHRVDGASVLCAQDADTGICPGDSGGPLVATVNRRPELVVITSFAGEILGKGCERGIAAGFADVGALRDQLTSPRPAFAPMPDGQVTVQGDKKPGSMLTYDAPRWTVGKPESVERKWYSADWDSNGKPSAFYRIEDETGPKLEVSEELAAQALMCVMTAKTKGGTVELYSEVV